MSTRDSPGRDIPLRPRAEAQPQHPDHASTGPLLPPTAEAMPPRVPKLPQLPPQAMPPVAPTPPQPAAQPVHPSQLSTAESPLVPTIPPAPGPPTAAVPHASSRANVPVERAVPVAATGAGVHAVAAQPLPTEAAQAGHPPSGDHGDLDADDAPSDLRRTIEHWRNVVVQFITSFAVPNAPPWMVSMLVHLAIVLVLALIALPRMAESTFIVEVSYADELGEQLLDDTHFLETIEPIEIDPALAFDANEVEDPLAASALPRIKLDLLESASEMETPAIGLALSGRESGAKQAMLAAYGGTGETENSVELALQWLKRNQKRDGTWSLAGPYKDGVSGTENPLAATAMALLAFQGAGNTHLSGEYVTTVKEGMEALLKMQDRDGSFFATQRIQSSHQLYSQAQATIAICELYGMTEDSALRDHAQRALDYAGSIQASDGLGGGGWRYQPGKDVDTSVTGWFVIALKSGEMGRLSVPQPVKDRISQYLDNSAAMPGDGQQFVHGSRYLYRVGERDERVSMTAKPCSAANILVGSTMIRGCGPASGMSARTRLIGTSRTCTIGTMQLS